MTLPLDNGLPKPGGKKGVCDHGEEKTCTFIYGLSIHGAEVYMCECGALIDIAAEKNYNAKLAMTPSELCQLMTEFVLHVQDEVVESLHAVFKKLDEEVRSEGR